MVINCATQVGFDFSSVLVDNLNCYEFARGTIMSAFHAGQHLHSAMRTKSEAINTKATVVPGESSLRN